VAACLERADEAETLRQDLSVIGDCEVRLLVTALAEKSQLGLARSTRRRRLVPSGRLKPFSGRERPTAEPHQPVRGGRDGS